MRKQTQTSIEMGPTLEGENKSLRARKRVVSLRKPLIIDYQSWMALTAGAAKAAGLEPTTR